MAVDCILIVEMEVRKTTRKPAYSRPASIFCHQIDPGRASKQHTARCKVGSPPRYHTKNTTGSNRLDSTSVRRARCLPATVTTHRCKRRWRSWRLRCPVHRPPTGSTSIGKAGETRPNTSGAAATIPEVERILRRDGRRASRFARTGAAALVQRKPVPDFSRNETCCRSRRVGGITSQCGPYRAALSGKADSVCEARTP